MKGFTLPAYGLSFVFDCLAELNFPHLPDNNTTVLKIYD